MNALKNSLAEFQRQMSDLMASADENTCRMMRDFIGQAERAVGALKDPEVFRRVSTLLGGKNPYREPTALEVCMREFADEKSRVVRSSQPKYLPSWLPKRGQSKPRPRTSGCAAKGYREEHKPAWVVQA